MANCAPSLICYARDKNRKIILSHSERGSEFEISLLIAILPTALIPVLAKAEMGDWVVSVRAMSVNPNEDSNLGNIVNKNLAPLAMKVYLNEVK